MKLLKRLLLFTRNLLDKLILKIDSPHWTNIDYVSLTNCTASNSDFSWFFTDLSGNNFTNCICNGTASTGINIYNRE